MKVIATNRLYAVGMAEHISIPHAIISITDPKQDFPEFKENANRIAVLSLVFYDIDFSKKIIADDESEIRRIYGFGLFTDEQADEIVDFVGEHKDKIKLLLVHCEAGVSRSAGVAGAILKATTGSDEKIFKDRRYLPNMWVYRKVLNAWHKEENHGDPIDGGDQKDN
jgi:predicted protein tyrosine phosphatase